MLEDRNSRKISDLTETDAKAHREWATAVRSHLANEHQRWGEALFRNQILGNTGGVAVIAALMGQSQAFVAATELRIALGAFVLGVCWALFALVYEFAGICRRLKAWDTCMPMYLRGEIPFGQLHGPEMYMRKLRWWDYGIIGLPLLCCFVGCVAGVAFVF